MAPRSALFLGAAFLVSACTMAGPARWAPAETPSLVSPPPELPVAPATTDFDASQDPSASGAPARPGQFFARASGPNGARLIAIDPTGGGLVRDLPLGTPDRNWKVVYTVQATDTQTTIAAVDAATGAVLRWIRTDGVFAAPTVGLGDTPTGLAADGHTLVLVSATTGEAAATTEVAEVRSRFALVDTSFAEPPRIVELTGHYSFDAVSPDGSVLYLIEHVGRGGNEYVVRAYDIAASRLRDGIIADKRRLGESMAGYPNKQLMSVDGAWAYTLYRNAATGPFIHALDLVHGAAVCIDLPGEDQPDEAVGRHWGLAMDPSGHNLYAANGELGVVVEVDLSAFAAVHEVRFSGDTALLPDPGASGALGGVAAGGSLVLVAGKLGVATFKIADLSPAGVFLPDWAIDDLAVSRDGRLALASSASREAVAVLDLVAGSVTEVPFATGTLDFLAAP